MTAKKALTLLAVLVAVQGTLLALYFAVAEPSPSPSHGLELVAEDRPELAFVSPDGSERRLSELRGRPVVLHFWATWCPPCRDELPSLLAWAEQTSMDVYAVTLDPEWGPVRTFMGGTLPPCVVRADSEAVTRAFGTQSLPETWVLDADGVTRARLRGPGDWSSDALRDAARELASLR